MELNSQSRKKTRASVGFRRDYLYYRKHHEDLDRIHTEANNMSEETVKSTRRMIRLANECQDAGVQTLAMLSVQEDQLNRTEKNLDAMNTHLGQAHKDLGKLEYGEELEKKDDWRCYFCYWCCKCYKCRKIDDSPSSPPLSLQATTMTPNNYVSEKSKTKEELQKYYASKADKRTKVESGFMGKMTNDEKETEAEQNLQEVAKSLSTLKVIAKDQGTTITKSSKQIDRLNVKAEGGKKKLSWAKARANKLLSS